MVKRVLATFLLVLLVGLLVGACGGGDSDPTATPSPTATPTQPSDGGTATGEIVNVVQKENPYVFEPDNYDFELNKAYTLVFAPPGEFHTFNVDALGIEIFINAGENVQQDITPSTAGTFKLYCVPHEALGMVGEVRVS